MGGLSYRPGLCTVLTGTMCFHSWVATWRHETGGLSLEGGGEEQKEPLVLQHRGEMSDYVKVAAVHSLMLFIALQTKGF